MEPQNARIQRYSDQPSYELKCPDCHEVIKEKEMKSHIKRCRDYIGIAYRQVMKFSKNIPVLELKLLMAELDLCREHIEEMVFQQSEEREEPKKNGVKSFIDVSDSDPFLNVSDDIVICGKCQKKFYSSFDLTSLFYVEQCWHLFCLGCVRKYVDEQFINTCGNIPCLQKGCYNAIGQPQLRQLLGEKYEPMYSKALRKMMNIVECAKCHCEYEFVAGNPRDAPKKDNNGKALTEEHALHYAENRFTCPRGQCKTQQCKECSAIPYHTGMTCKQFKKHSEMMKCRYCESALTEKNKSKTNIEAHRDICNEKQCQQLAKTACTKILPCGHPCPGVAGEKQCLPCLHEKCCEDNPELNGQTGDDYCNICFVEALTASPCVRSSCGHIFHQKCVRKRYEIRWLTPRILFNFCLCPLCKKWINLPEENKLSGMIQQNAELFNRIQTMAVERLKFEECDKDEKLTNPKSAYYQKPKEYAMAIYAYFECFKCKKPYFGGRKNCADAMNEGQNAGSYNPKDLICPNCCDVPIENCPKHGKDFIEFKCKFCCSVAQWFCWGNTHFCEPCHKRQCQGDYVSKYSKDKLPKCQGAGVCPIGGNHNGNGEERTLGCAICRNYKANNKNF